MVIMDYKKALLSNIDKIAGKLRDEKELEFILKKRLTKKEFKVFCSKEAESEDSEICELVNCDMQRLEELYSSALKKINQERIKQEFVK